MTTTVELRSSPEFRNEPFYAKGSFGPDILLGYATAAYALLDDAANTYFSIIGREMRDITRGDIRAYLDNNDVIILEGEAAHDFTPDDIGFTGTMQELGVNPTKRYTAKVEAPRSVFYVQFDSEDFVRAFDEIMRAFGVEEGDAYLREIREGDFEM